MEQISSKDYCQECRGCCAFEDDEVFFAPVCTDEEVATFVEKYKKPADCFEKKDGLHQIKLVKYQDHNICPFLDTKSWLCTVYNDRPFDCKIYPYLLMWDEKHDNIVLGFHEGECIAHDSKGKEYEQSYRKYIIDYLNSPQIAGMLLKNQNLIWRYDRDFNIVHKFKELTEMFG